MIEHTTPGFIVNITLRAIDRTASRGIEHTNPHVIERTTPHVNEHTTPRVTEHMCKLKDCPLLCQLPVIPNRNFNSIQVRVVCTLMWL